MEGRCDEGLECIEGICLDPEDTFVWADPVNDLEWFDIPPRMYESDGTYGTTFGSQGQAADYCDGLGFDGFENWRIPTVGELRSLLRGCDPTEEGGACGVTDSCHSYEECFDSEDCWFLDECGMKEGPGLAGCYLPEEMEYPTRIGSGTGGACPEGWSSSLVEDNSVYPGETHFWTVSFSNGDIGHSEETFSGVNAICVRSTD